MIIFPGSREHYDGQVTERFLAGREVVRRQVLGAQGLGQVHAAGGGGRAMLLAVPFSPRVSIPPMAGLMALSGRTSFSCSCPTMAAKGVEGGASPPPSLPTLGEGGDRQVGG